MPRAGRLLVNMVLIAVEGVAGKTGRNLIFQVHLPTQEGEDWNQVVQRARQNKFVQGAGM